MVKGWWLLLPVCLLSFGQAHAQNIPLGAIVVSSCGTPNNTYPSGQNRPITMDTTGKLCLNNAGSSGTVTLISNSDGTIVLAPNPIVSTGTVSLNLAHANTWTAVQSFTNGDLSLLGSSSGNSLLEAPASGGGTATLPTGSGTLVYSSGAVTSIAGTANQITASASTGAVTLSLPSTLIAPGTFAATSGNFGGATLGTDTLGVNGTASLGNLNVTSSTIPANGIYLSAANQAGFSTNNVLRYTLSLATGFNSNVSGGARLGPGAGSSTICTLIPNNTAPTTCFSGDGTNLYGIFAGVTGVTWAPTGETITASTFGASSTASGLTDNCTWNDAGTTFKGCLLVNAANTASATGSMLQDWQLSGVSKASLSELGSLTLVGSVAANGSASVGAAGTYSWGGRGILSSPNTGIIQCGSTDAVAPVACIFQNQSVSAGNGNTAGATFTIAGSKSNGSGCGDLVFQTTLGTAASGTQNTLATAMTLKGCTQSVVFASGISSTGIIPTVTGTGTPTIATGSTDTAGEVTSGSAATSVVITFAASKTNAPFCAVTAQTQLVAFAYTLSTTAITITQTATTGEKIDYACFQH